MKTLFVSLVCLASLAVVMASPLPPDSSVKPLEVLRVPSYCEGIVFDHEGNAYISHGKFITRITPKGKAKVWAEIPAPNGHKVLADDTHLVCDRGAVLHLDVQGKIIGKASWECDGQPLREPNDLTLDPANGGFYFTDPGGSREKPIGTVHYVDAHDRTHLVAGHIHFPNGIVLRPDGKTLLVDESYRNRVLEFPVLSPGKVGPMRVFADLPSKQGEQMDNQPDGMCLDEDGNLYVAHYGMRQVQVLDPQGKIIRRYPAGNLMTSNVAFGGPNMDQLFITGGLESEGSGPGVLFRLDLKGVRGLNILPRLRQRK